MAEGGIARAGDESKGGGEKPHYLGHRRRLRERFLATAGEGMPDYELLEILLGQAILRQDVKPIAKALVERFGSLAGALSADPAELLQVNGIGEAAATALKLVQAAALRLARQQIMKRDIIGSWAKLLDRTDEHTSELQSLMRISYDVFCLKKNR